MRIVELVWWLVIGFTLGYFIGEGRGYKQAFKEARRATWEVLAEFSKEHGIEIKPWEAFK